MKKILALSLILMIFSVAASAQRGPVRHRTCNSRQLTRYEKMDLRHDAVRLGASQRLARRDGMVTPREHMRINHQKRNIRREAFIYRHNGRRPVI